MMNLLVDLFLRVFLPLVGKPHGVTGCRPPEVRPSPPPCGWSIGFIDTPRLCGMRPIQRLRPALPMEIFMWSGLDTADRRHAAPVHQALLARVETQNDILTVP